MNSKVFTYEFSKGGIPYIEVGKQCSVTDISYVVHVKAEQYKRWKEGTYIQNAMPNLSADEREFLMSGITPHEWEKMFGGESNE